MAHRRRDNYNPPEPQARVAASMPRQRDNNHPPAPQARVAASMPRQRDNIAPPPPTSPPPIPTKPAAVGPSMPDIDLIMYGGRMTITGNPNNRWSYRYGVNNMRYYQADSETDFTVTGQLPMSSLKRGHRYRGVFELELNSDASGWEGEFVVSLDVPGSRRAVEARSRKHDKIGAFTLESRSFELAAAPQRDAFLSFSLSHTGPCIRNGLIVKHFVIKQA